MFCCPGRNLEGVAADYLDVVRKNHVVLPGAFTGSTISPVSTPTSTGSQNNRVDVVSVSKTREIVVTMLPIVLVQKTVCFICNLV